MTALTRLLNIGYQAAFPFINLVDAQLAHAAYIESLRLTDHIGWLADLNTAIRERTLVQEPVRAGGVDLPHPLMLAAGLIKGDGFEAEGEALHAARSGTNIMPGWRSLPALIGTAEFGSFTRYPRMGNSGRVLWRHAGERSTQNRIGLRNPGAAAAAEFLSRHHAQLPDVYGINIAISPGVDDPDEQQQHITRSVGAFTFRGVQPAWYTLNLSCPNTEDDPSGNQTEAKARDLCGVMREAVGDTPLWVKIGPCLSETQYAALMKSFAEVGVNAVIATNTLPSPTPDGTATAGIGGQTLHQHALEAVNYLHAAKVEHGYPIDIIGCGGVIDGQTYHAFVDAGAAAVQYYTATVYRSPFAAAIIQMEAEQ
ncbi:MAG: hypothetical protein AAFR56_05135 [Chloroflexota bacterium]